MARPKSANPKPPGVTLKVPLELMDEVRRIAVEEQRTQIVVIERALRVYLKQRSRKALPSAGVPA